MKFGTWILNKPEKFTKEMRGNIIFLRISSLNFRLQPEVSFYLNKISRQHKPN